MNVNIMEESNSLSKISRVKKGPIRTPYYQPDRKQKKKSGKTKKISSATNRTPTLDSIEVR